MSEVEFEEAPTELHIRSRKILGEPATPTMIRLLLKTGWVKNEKQAVAVLLVIIAAGFVVAYFVTFGIASDQDTIRDRSGRVITIQQYQQLVRQDQLSRISR